ncbi:MAG: HD domain-containing protein [Candidatus Geothermarchaeales archaeon]
MISRGEALKLLDENVSDPNIKKHMIAVSSIMRDLAHRFNQDEEPWMLTGLLHDIDYERVGRDLDRHGSLSAEMLQGKLTEACLHAIRAHNRKTGVEAENLLDKALIAADAVSGLIVASALVMPSKRLHEVRVKTLKKKFKDKSFARNVDRGKIMICEGIDLSLEEFFDIALKSLQRISEELNL